MATGEKSVIVAGIDESSHSFYALQWTLDHLILPTSSNASFKLVVVFAKPLPSATVSLVGPVLPYVESDLKKIATRVLYMRNRCSIALAGVYQSKNCYSDVLPFDSNRVFWNGKLISVGGSIGPVVKLNRREADIVINWAGDFIMLGKVKLLGVFAVKGESLARNIYFLQNAEGSGLAQFDCWFCLRGIKTMALCVEKQQTFNHVYAKNEAENQGFSEQKTKCFRAEKWAEHRVYETENLIAKS